MRSPSAPAGQPGRDRRLTALVILVVCAIGVALSLLTIAHEPIWEANQERKIAAAASLANGEAQGLEAGTQYLVYETGAGLAECAATDPGGREIELRSIITSSPVSVDSTDWTFQGVFIADRSGNYVIDCASEAGEPHATKVLESGLKETRAGPYLSAIGVLGVVVFVIVGWRGLRYLRRGKNPRSSSPLEGSESHPPPERLPQTALDAGREPRQPPADETPGGSGRVGRRVGAVLIVVSVSGLLYAGFSVIQNRMVEAAEDTKLAAAPILDRYEGLTLRAGTQYSLYESGPGAGACRITAPDGSKIETGGSLGYSVDADGKTWETEGRFTTTEAGNYTVDCAANGEVPHQAKVVEGGGYEPLEGLYVIVIALTVSMFAVVALCLGLSLVLRGRKRRKRDLLDGGP